VLHCTIVVLFTNFAAHWSVKGWSHLHTLSGNCLRFPANSYHICTVELALKGVLCTHLGRKGRVCDRKWDRASYAMLMGPDKDETAVHGCHCWGDIVVRMRKALAIPRSWLCVFQCSPSNPLFWKTNSTMLVKKNKKSLSVKRNESGSWNRVSCGNPFNPKIKIWILICCPLFVSYRSKGEKLIKYQANSSCVIMSVILMTTLFYKALILQGEIWCWSLSLRA